MSGDPSRLPGWRTGTADDGRPRILGKHTAPAEGLRPAPTEEEWAESSNLPLGLVYYPYFSQKQENIDEWRRRRDIREWLELPPAPEQVSLRQAADQARERAREWMAGSNDLVEVLHIEGRRRWFRDPRYASVSGTYFEDDVLYLLEQLPPEVEWAYWMVERGSNDQSLRLLHRLARRDALKSAEAMADHPIGPRRDALGKSAKLSDKDEAAREVARWDEEWCTLDAKGKLCEDFALVGFSYVLWGQTRRPQRRSYEAIQIAERARLEEKVKEQLTELARRLGYPIEEVGRFPRGKPTVKDAKRRDIVAPVVKELRNEGVKQQTIADTLGVDRTAVLRLERHDESKCNGNAKEMRGGR